MPKHLLLRTPEIIKALYWTPMTAEILHIASASFKHPYPSGHKVHGDLYHLYKNLELIDRIEIPRIGPGQFEYIYFLKKKASTVLPELKELNFRNAVFRPPFKDFDHYLGISRFLAHAMRSASESDGEIVLLEIVRDHFFIGNVEVGEPNLKSPNAVQLKKTHRVEPDLTLLVRIGGKLQLFFLELQNEHSVTSPSSQQSVIRSFEFKLPKYKALLPCISEHPKVREWSSAFGEEIRTFRMLTVTTKTEANRSNLLRSASKYHDLFYFATLEDIGKRNAFTDPIWHLPSKTIRAIHQQSH